MKDSRELADKVIRAAGSVASQVLLGGTLALTDENVMYLGREDFYSVHVDYDHGNNHDTSRVTYLAKTKKIHAFVRQDGEYWTQTGFTGLAARSTMEPD